MIISRQSLRHCWMTYSMSLLCIILSNLILLAVASTNTVDSSSLLAECTNIQPRYPPPNTLACHRTRVRQIGPFQTCDASFVRQMPISRIADSNVNYTIFYLNSPGRLRGRTYNNRLLCRWNIQCPNNQLMYMDIVEHDIEPKRQARLFRSPVCVDYLKMLRDFGSETSCDYLTPHSDLEPGRLLMEFRSNKKVRFPGFRMRIVCFNPQLQGIRGCSPTLSLQELGINLRGKRDANDDEIFKTKTSEMFDSRRKYLKPFLSLKPLKLVHKNVTDDVRQRRNAIQQQLFLEPGSTLVYKDNTIEVISNNKVAHSISSITALHTYNSLDGLQSFYGTLHNVEITGQAILTVIQNKGYFYQFGVNPKFQPDANEESVIHVMLESEEQLVIDQDFIIESEDTTTTEAPPTEAATTNRYPHTGNRGKRQSSVTIDERVIKAARVGTESCNAIVRAVAQSLLRVAGQN